MREDVLQHRRLVLSGSVRCFEYQRLGIVVQLDAQSFGDGQAFVDERLRSEERRVGKECRL